MIEFKRCPVMSTFDCCWEIHRVHITGLHFLIILNRFHLFNYLTLSLENLKILSYTYWCIGVGSFALIFQSLRKNLLHSIVFIICSIFNLLQLQIMVCSICVYKLIIDCGLVLWFTVFLLLFNAYVASHNVLHCQWFRCHFNLFYWCCIFTRLVLFNFKNSFAVLLLVFRSFIAMTNRLATYRFQLMSSLHPITLPALESDECWSIQQIFILVLRKCIMWYPGLCYCIIRHKTVARQFTIVLKFLIIIIFFWRRNLFRSRSAQFK